MKECDNTITNIPVAECDDTRVYMPFKKFFKLIKKGIKIADSKEDLNKVYDKAIEYQNYFSKGQGQLIEELYFSKMKTL